MTQRVFAPHRPARHRHAPAISVDDQAAWLEIKADVLDAAAEVDPDVADGHRWAAEARVAAGMLRSQATTEIPISDIPPAAEARMFDDADEYDQAFTGETADTDDAGW